MTGGPERECENDETSRRRTEGKKKKEKDTQTQTNKIKTLTSCIRAKRVLPLREVKRCSDGAPELSAQTILDYLHIPALWTHL